MLHELSNYFYPYYTFNNILMNYTNFDIVLIILNMF